MEKAYEFWNVSIIPNIEKIYLNKYLVAIRQSFYVLMPFWLIISVFEILVNIFLDPNGLLLGEQGLNLGFWITGETVGEEYLNSNFAHVLNTYRQILVVGYSIVSLTITLTLSSKLADILESDKMLTIFCSMSAFLLMSLNTSSEKNFIDYFNHIEFFTAFFTTFTASALFAKLSKIPKLKLKIPASFPEEMSKYLSASLSIFLTIMIFSIIALIISLISQNIDGMMEYLSTLPIFQNLFFVLLYQFVVWFLWWLGIPGYGVTSTILENVYIPAQASNQIGDTSSIFTIGFFETGVIHVLGLMIAILVFSQHERWRSVSKFSLPFMFLNVQEIFVFGLPVILNPIFIVPYILAPLANTIVGYVAISWGIVPIFQTDIPWSMTLFLGAMFGTHSIMGCILQVVWLVMDIFIYAPFVITANSIEVKE